MSVTSTQIRSDVDVRGLTFRGGVFKPAGESSTCSFIETFGGVNEATYRDWASGTGTPKFTTSISIDGAFSEYTGTSEEECACLAGPRTDPCWFMLGLVFNSADKYFSKQAASARELGLTSFDINPTTRRFALAGTITLREWLTTNPPLPEGSPAPDVRFAFSSSNAQSCDGGAQLPGGTAKPFVLMLKLRSLWNPGNLSRRADTRSRCALAAPATLVRVSLDGTPVPVIAAAVTTSSTKDVVVEAGNPSSLSGLPRPLLDNMSGQ
ncbi:hypothetical protein HYH02_001832 [Chlamydomonas schloesseri]|uniref:Uncharacterized protein n=1 Tax=Chlamydomonas schloesseri TaxID=2026947 RepID=A0A835WUD4_9CHLO|nr:hypothetical protein HYH02_001832 [Chlamydomonas schloesseri]|eukprot:KAG2453617.1 hypothetical protein HYH02_001832 [Chlamydomonas schloesseri]